MNARDAREPEVEEEVDERDTFDKVALPVKGALEESRRDLAGMDTHTNPRDPSCRVYRWIEVHLRPRCFHSNCRSG